MTQRIRVYVINKDAFVWRVDDVVRLRDMYRITGTLVESLPRQPMQNILHGLPLILLPEEVTLLLSLNAVRLVDERRAYRDATEAERAGACHVVTQQAARIHLPTATPDEAVWHEERCGDTAFDSWEAAREAGVWVFPENALECRRFRVYRDLWERGWWLSSGLKFGGDYLAYEADPRFCHSALVVTVCGQAERFTFTQLVGLGRLGTTVRKARLFASVAEASDAQHPLLETASDPHWPVMYLRVEWAGW